MRPKSPGLTYSEGDLTIVDMTINKKGMICRLLKGIETGDPESVAVVNEDKYVQHNPQTHQGSEGHSDQQHSSFFDLYRVHQGLIVEHWDTTETIPPRSEWKNDNGKF